MERGHNPEPSSVGHASPTSHAHRNPGGWIIFFLNHVVAYRFTEPIPCSSDPFRRTNRMRAQRDPRDSRRTPACVREAPDTGKRRLRAIGRASAQRHGADRASGRNPHPWSDATSRTPGRAARSWPRYIEKTSRNASAYVRAEDRCHGRRAPGPDDVLNDAPPPPTIRCRQTCEEFASWERYR